MRSARAAIGMLMVLLAAPSHATSREEIHALAVAFGTMPSVWGARLSPDGSKISFLQMHASGVPIASVFDLATKKLRVVLASDQDRFDLSRCRWGNAERLLCSFSGVDRGRGGFTPITRLVAVNADGVGSKVLMQGLLRGEYGQFQDEIIDLLPDQPKKVLIKMPKGFGSGVSALNIYTGTQKTVVRPRDHVHRWISDGHGKPRLRYYLTDNRSRWDYRRSGEKRWQELHVDEDEEDSYQPTGFGSDLDKLLVFKRMGGRYALFSEDLTNDQSDELIFSHPAVDVSGVQYLGKYSRMVGVAYETNMPHIHYFDEKLERVSSMLASVFENQKFRFIDETWDGSIYFLHVSSDRNAGAYYLLDISSEKATQITDTHPKLKGRKLASMEPIDYQTDDGVSVPAYLTLPPGKPARPLPTIILPHGGPESRDSWGFDFLPQFLAASGYAVLQSNYRGSGGYGEQWSGEGGFIEWKRAMADLEAGARALVERGIADPDRMCIVGWSYGGYAALMSPIEYPKRYKCAVSIAGVTDPESLRNEWGRFLGGSKTAKEFIGDEDSVVEAGSPRRRAAEMPVPVLLFHGDEDINVNVDHSKKLERALRKKKKPVEYHEYADAEHSIRRSEYRIDMLEKIGIFLDQHLSVSQ